METFPDDLAEVVHLIDGEATRLAARWPATFVRQQLKSLVNALESGEIDPVGALGQLSPPEAQVVRRLALACLIAVACRIESTRKET